MLTMDMNFPELLRSLRLRKKLTQQQLADRIFVDRSSLAHWEIGRRTPDAVTISRLARCLDVDVSELLNIAAKDSLENAGFVYEKEARAGKTSPDAIVVDRDADALLSSVSVLSDCMPELRISGFLNASEAESHAASIPVSLAFLEITLKGTNGIELCRRLMAVNPMTNVIFLTDSPDYSLNAWKTGASGFILKPLSSGEIIKQLQKLRHPLQIANKEL